MTMQLPTANSHSVEDIAAALTHAADSLLAIWLSLLVLAACAMFCTAKYLLQKPKE